MSTLTRFVCGSLVAVAALTSAIQAPEARLATPLAGTPTPSACAGPIRGGTPVASPESASATPSPALQAMVVDEQSLIDALEAKGITVEQAGALQQAFFNADRASRLLLSGGSLSGGAELQVYAYEDAATLAADISQVSPDGNLKTVIIEWIAAPHFFCGERLMVIYLGDDQEAIDLLTDLLGPQFAGR